jgi:hypothetical protein
MLRDFIINHLGMAQGFFLKGEPLGGSHETKVRNTHSEIRFAHAPSWCVFDPL